MHTILRAIAISILLLAVIAHPALSAQRRSNADDPKIAVCTTLPWITSITNFLASTTMDVAPLSSWSASGGIKKLRAPKDVPMIALDPKDAAAFGIPLDHPSLYLLYDNLPVRDISRGSIAFDPSVLPFMSQRLLIAISEIDAESYPFHQRRLAEFQSRLESTLEVGRSLIGGMKMLDLTGSVGPWIKAASDTVRPPDDLRAAWMGSTRTDELRMALDQARSRGWWIVTDPWTPPVVLKIAASEKKLLHIDAPTDAGYDFFAYLHDIYIKIWSAAAAK